MNAGLFEIEAQDWLVEKYPAWFAKPKYNHRFLQVIRADDQLAGRLLARMKDPLQFACRSAWGTKPSAETPGIVKGR